MLDNQEAGTIPAAIRGFAEGRTGAGLAIAGVALLAATGAELLRGPAVVHASLATALLVFGGYLLALRGRRFLLARQGRRAAIVDWFASAGDPVVLTRLDGAILGRNPAAREAPGLLGRATIYRLTREVQLNGLASEEAPDGRSRITAMRCGPNRLLWRHERLAGVAGPVTPVASETLDLPRLALAPDGSVRAGNPAAAALGATPDELVCLLDDAARRPEGVHFLADGSRAVRVVPLPDRDGCREVALVPIDAAEIAGLVPERFIEELPVALARLEPDGELTMTNRAARQLLGPAAQPGANICTLLEGLGLPIPERLADTMKGRALGRSEVARRIVDGQEFFLQLAFTRTVLDGRSAILAVLSDATELKTLEQQFVQSQKMQAVGQLAGGVAHDFNNLLTAINGHCDLILLRHDVTDVEHGDLMQIRQNANRAAALVRQLLAFSRKQTLRPTVINLQDTLGELTHLLNRLLTDKVTLRIEHGSDLWPVRADERQIEQVIMNLVVNARDAMPRGGEVRVTTRNVRLEQDSHRDRAVILKGDYVVIEVADSGHGIPEGKLNKIFEPFFTTKQVGEGTGLGLSTAYGIVKQTGGFIFADSPDQRGAIFTIYLPAYDKAETPPPVAAEPRRPRDLTGRGLVLLVEDEDPVRSFAARALRLRGYTVVEAASGEEALEILNDRGLHVDLMLSDVIMPGLDGPGWVREALKARPDTKVIFMSGYAEDAFVGGDGGVPGAAFLPKPFTLIELTEKVKDHLGA
ncbi:MAG: ATP-binding protein [Amaricoccus sp.]|uniref:ATP-binding protein n=1 Tax=Amaricoccus sp. TaxID=1872485 RepID=UPI0039E26DBE